MHTPCHVTARHVYTPCHSHCSFQVTISDNGNPPLSSSTRVVIKVMDENDNRPKFVDRAGRLTVLAETKSSHDILVYRTLAYDVDEGPNAEITYTLRSTLDDQFFISSRTGEIFSRKDLVAGQNFDLTVSGWKELVVSLCFHVFFPFTLILSLKFPYLPMWAWVFARVFICESKLCRPFLQKYSFSH